MLLKFDSLTYKKPPLKAWYDRVNYIQIVSKLHPHSIQTLNLEP